MTQLVRDITTHDLDSDSASQRRLPHRPSEPSLSSATAANAARAGSDTCAGASDALQCDSNFAVSRTNAVSATAALFTASAAAALSPIKERLQQQAGWSDRVATPERPGGRASLGGDSDVPSDGASPGPRVDEILFGGSSFFV